MASELQELSVSASLANVASAVPAPRRSHQHSVHLSTTITQPRKSQSQRGTSSRSPTAAMRGSRLVEARSTTWSFNSLPVMESESSSRASCSGRSKSEHSGEDEWALSKGSDTAHDEHTTEDEVFRFMDLPDEIRRLMYSYFLSIPPGEEFQLDQSIVDWSFNAVSAAILKTSKEVYLEAFPVFLRENRFLIGTSLTNPKIFRNFGSKRCAYLRSLSIQLNDRSVEDCIQILDELSEYCEEIRHLELRVSPGSPFLPYLTSILAARTQAGSLSRTEVVFRVFVRKSDAVPAGGPTVIVQAAENILNSFDAEFRWPQILRRAHEVIIRGTIFKSCLEVLEGFQQGGWHFEETSTLPVTDCPTTQQNVTRTWVRDD